MPRKKKARSAAQIRQTDMMHKKRWAGHEEAEEVGEVYRCMTIEEYKVRMAKAEKEAEKGHKDLRNAERRLERMAERVETTKHETGLLEANLDQTKKQLEAVTTECTRWEEKTAEVRRTLRRLKVRETRGPKKISAALEPAITALANSGKPLRPPGHRVAGRVFELVNELAFSWHLPTPMIEGIVGSVSRATADVCYGLDEIDTEYESDGDAEGSPVPDAAVAGPSNTVGVPPEEPSTGEIV